MAFKTLPEIIMIMIFSGKFFDKWLKKQAILSNSHRRSISYNTEKEHIVFQFKAR